MIELGDKAKDVITGYTGIVTGKTEWINKCLRFCIQAQEMKDGKPVEGQWFDVEQLEVVEKKVVVIDKPIPTGGPRDVETGSRKDPTR